MNDENTLEDLDATNADEVKGAGAAIPPPGHRMPRMEVRDPGVHVETPDDTKLRNAGRRAAEEILPDPS